MVEKDPPIEKLRKEGDTYVWGMDIPGEPEPYEVRYKLGEDYETDAPDGNKYKVVFFKTLLPGYKLPCYLHCQSP